MDMLEACRNLLLLLSNGRLIPGLSLTYPHHMQARFSMGRIMPAHPKSPGLSLTYRQGQGQKARKSTLIFFSRMPLSTKCSLETLQAWVKRHKHLFITKTSFGGPNSPMVES